MSDVDDLMEKFEKAGIDFDAVESLAEALAEQKASKRVRNRLPETVDRLRAICEAFNARAEFKVGDVVRWKDGLKNKRNPAYDSPAVVFAVLEEPLFDEEGSGGSQYFREPLDLVIGLFPESDSGGEDRSVRTFYVDSRRVEHHPDFS